MPSWIQPHRVVAAILHQRWRSLTFLHWPYAPDVIARHLPPGLEADLFDGTAWVGLTPFSVDTSVVPFLPWPTWPGNEINVRTYVRAPDGTDGLWFFTLEFDRPALATVLGTASRLPYRRARIAVDRRADTVRYRSERAGSRGPARFRGEVEAGPASTEVSAFETFLVGRWRAYTRLAGRLASVPVSHRPWPLRSAVARDLEIDLLTACGLPPPEGDPHTMFSDGVRARFGSPRPVG